MDRESAYGGVEEDKSMRQLKENFLITLNLKYMGDADISNEVPQAIAKQTTQH